MSALEVAQFLLNQLIDSPVLNIGAVCFGLWVGWQIAEQAKAIYRYKTGKRKNESLTRFSVPYDQDTDDDKPKRQTYMTIGDDGELVEIEK